VGRRPGSKNRIRVNLDSPENRQILQDAAFPVDNASATAENLRQDADAKDSVRKAAAAIPEIFTPEQVKWVFDAYVSILCFVYSIVLKTDFKVLENELEFSEDEKEAMAKPLAKICSKYAPASWAGMSAEIELVTCLSIWTVASFRRAQNVAVKEEEKKRDAQRTHPVQPMRRQPTEVAAAV
jgi:hypothetical protein